MTSLLLSVAVGLLLGTALGLFGGGGGILAVPLLVGLLGMDVDHAATTSLVIVLFGALAGLAAHHRAGRVRWRAGAVFGSASVVGAIAGAALAVVAADWVKLAAFAVLLTVAGLAMLRNARTQPSEVVRLPAAAGTDMCGMPVPAGQAAPARTCSLPLVVLLATGTGLVTGFLGVGGGFLVVPALVLTLRMPVAYATATGLLVVAISSTAALAVRLAHAESLDQPGVTAALVLAAIGASTVAARFSGRISPRRLATGFAVLVLVMAVLVAGQALQALQAA